MQPDTDIDIRKAYEAHKLEGEQPHIIYSYQPHKIKTGETTDEDGNIVETFKIVHRRVEKKVSRPMGTLVITAKGDAFHIPTDDMLRRLGFDKDAPLVDMATGEVLQTPDRSLTAMASRVGALIPSDVTFGTKKGGK